MSETPIVRDVPTLREVAKWLEAKRDNAIELYQSLREEYEEETAGKRRRSPRAIDLQEYDLPRWMNTAKALANARSDFGHEFLGEKRLSIEEITDMVFGRLTSARDAFDKAVSYLHAEGTPE